ncbi:LLM class flavin-dependent oxidoreductase [Mycolicibacterium fluoranthenivorans]|uniref:LLM class flavin-dependent oxidoreductase n=1 Tax=Mycolicibacterium fluoranthenivorans TaxID=258505 RepID=A0A7G8P9E3_9MYCO|nr:LLM class flavin-dependent oxidoreductase [Mycolicibacterium fluoranthenivorans]QNJ90959.1 LLM class flavin-dependent oxidoreductase [Mycolicibacterium fluoranthenivorans]
MDTNPTRTRLGVVFRPQIPPERLGAAARAADEAGVDELWLWEDCFLAGGLSSAAIALSHSANLTVGVGVLPVPMRNVALAAMEIATLERAFPGRVRIGVGHGVQDWMAQIGERVASPMTLLREYLTCLTALLRGNRVTFHGRYVNLDDVGLDWPPTAGAEVLAAATGPKTLRLSGELASGTVLSGGTTPDGVRKALTEIRAGGELRTEPARHSVVTYVLCATGPTADADLRAEIEHWELDPAEDVGVAGDAAQVAAGVRRWVDAGADTVVLQPSADVAIEDFVRFVGAEVGGVLARAGC